MVIDVKEGEELHAHTPNQGAKWHMLSDHLESVATLSQAFAEQFRAGEMGWTLGLLHDIGKFNPDFQRYLRQCWQEQSKGGPRPHSTPHSIYGGLSANRNQLPLLAFAAVGHHGGIPDVAKLRASLANEQLPDWMAEAEAALLDGLSIPQLPMRANDPTSCEFFVRMLFSCLVDADWLDTEAHFDRRKAGMRGNIISMDDLWSMFEHNQTSLMGRLSEATDSQVNQARGEIYKACVAASVSPILGKIRPFCEGNLHRIECSSER